MIGEKRDILYFCSFLRLGPSKTQPGADGMSGYCAESPRPCFWLAPIQPAKPLDRLRGCSIEAPCRKLQVVFHLTRISYWFGFAPLPRSKLRGICSLTRFKQTTQDPCKWARHANYGPLSLWASHNGHRPESFHSFGDSADVGRAKNSRWGMQWVDANAAYGRKIFNSRSLMPL